MDPIGLGIVILGAAASAISSRGDWKKTPVQAIVGEPGKVEVASGVTIWSYTPGGRPVFAHDKLVAWTEPKV